MTRVTAAVSSLLLVLGIGLSACGEDEEPGPYTAAEVESALEVQFSLDNPALQKAGEGVTCPAGQVPARQDQGEGARFTCSMVTGPGKPDELRLKQVDSNTFELVRVQDFGYATETTTEELTLP